MFIFERTVNLGIIQLDTVNRRYYHKIMKREYVLEHYEENDQLTETEKSAARYILEHMGECCYLTAEEVGKRSFTSGSTVTRLAKKIGYRGFSDMKVALSSHLSLRTIDDEADENIPFSVEDSDVEVAEKIIQLNLHAINQVRETLDIGLIRQAVNLISTYE